MMDPFLSLEGFCRALELDGSPLRRRAMFANVALDLKVDQPRGLIEGWATLNDAWDAYLDEHPLYKLSWIRAPVMNKGQSALPCNWTILDGNGGNVQSGMMTARFDRSGRIKRLENFPALSGHWSFDPDIELAVRRLKPSDADAFRDIRLESLDASPEAFGSSLNEERDWPVSKFSGALRRNQVFGGFIDNELLGIIGLHRKDGIKLSHKGMIYGVYLRPAARGTGLSDRLMQAAIEVARKKLEAVELGVGVYNTSARRLYERHGFRAFGTEPNALKVGNDRIDEVLMQLSFID